MKMLDKWMRVALLATAAMNMIGCLLFVPSFIFARHLFGLPDAHPFYLWLLSSWIGAFGVVYLWLGLTGKPDQAFIAIAAAGKLSFWGLLFIYWLVGELPLTAPLLGLGDLIFGLIFVRWLWFQKTAS